MKDAAYSPEVLCIGWTTRVSNKVRVPRFCCDRTNDSRVVVESSVRRISTDIIAEGFVWNSNGGYLKIRLER